MDILITGAAGFVGKNLTAALAAIRDGKDRTHPGLEIEKLYLYDIDSSEELLEEACRKADFVFNLAGVNRPQNQEEFMQGNFGFASTLLEKLKKLCIREPLPFDDVLMLSYILQVFCLLNQKNFQPKNEIASLPENILILQRYIDDNFARISSVSEVAEHFYYSREYLSRLFKKYFDTSISDYIMKRRIAESQLLIAQDIPLIDIAYQVGFGSLSTFIRAFRTVTNMTPSEYRKNRKHV